MKSKNTLLKVASTFLIGGMVLSTGGLALAQTSAKNAKTQIAAKAPSIAPTLKSVLTSLVKAKSITQTTSTTLLNYYNKKVTAKSKAASTVTNLLSSAVTDKIITQTQANKIKQKITALQNAQINAKLSPLVKAKTITQAQANKIVTYYAKYSNTAFSKLVTAKIITQAQADKVKNTLNAKPTQSKQIQSPNTQQSREQQIKTKLSSLVKTGTITQAQADKIAAAYNKMEADRASSMQNLKSMTQEQRKTYMEQNKNKDPLAQLVTDGVITQAQSDSIKAAIAPKRNFNRTKVN